MTQTEREKVLALLRVHYNLYHSDVILAAIEDDDIATNELLGGERMIAFAEKTDNLVEPFITLML